MSDGIIQRCFKSEIELQQTIMRAEKPLSAEYIIAKNTKEKLEQLQAEIIAEIQRHECGCNHHYVCHYDTCKNAVIGDAGQ